LALAVVAVVLLVVSFALRNQLPKEIVVATAARGGLYHQLAEALERKLEVQAGRSVSLRVTEGSSANRQLLLAGEVDLAIVQVGAVALDGLAVLAPLYEDVVFILVRTDAQITSIPDLAGRGVALGPPGSGMRVSAEQVLRHYGVRLESLRGTDAYFGSIGDDPDFQAAIVTTGLLNPDLDQLLRRGNWSLLPIQDAEAFTVRHPLYTPFVVPRGLYGESPPRPAAPTPTLATTAVLVAQRDVSDRLVASVLAALYQGVLRRRIPRLLSAAEASAWRTLALHPTARRHFDPYGGLDLLANFMESLAAIKELLVAFGAGLYLLWTRRRWRHAREQEGLLSEMKERLDVLLDRTARIEHDQIGETDRDILERYLDRVTEIKLEALDELTHEDLRGDRMFLIFLIQCGSLIERIQGKLAAADPRIASG
jgi:TRAP transporter TAXI family solute receptor